MAIELGTLYTTIEAQLKGYETAEKGTDKLAKSMLRQADAVKKAELELERLRVQLKDTAGSAKYIAQAESALVSFKNRAKEAGNSSVLFSAAQKDFKNQIAGTKTGLMGAGVATTGWQTRMQELTKSVQLALGPLSGVASRITALTALFNRSTLIWAGLFAGITAMTVGMYKAVAAGTLYEASMAKITHQLEMTGHASGQTTEDIDRMTKALAINTLASVQGARDAATAILTFTSITGDNVERTLNLAQDLTDSLGGDLLANAKKLGKMFEDPSKAFEALNEMGARLSDTEKSRLKVMAATGDHLGAQEALFAKIEARVKGIGKAGATGTLAGAYDTLGESITLLFESVSKNSGLLDTFKAAINGISESIQTWTKIIDAGYKPLEVFGDIIGGVIDGMAWMVKNIHVLIGAFGGLAFVKVITLLYTSYTMRAKEATVATTLFSGALKRIPFVAIASAVTGAVVGWLAYSSAAKEARRATDSLTSSNKEFLQSQKSKEMEELKIRIEATKTELNSYQRALDINNKTLATSIIHQKDRTTWLEVEKKSQESNTKEVTRLSTELEELNKRYTSLATGAVENAKSAQGQVDALTRLIASYNPASESVRKFTEDQTILSAGLDKAGGKFLTLDRYISSYGNKADMSAQQIAMLTKEYNRFMATLSTTQSMMDLASPFQKAKEDLDKLVMAQRSASQAAGKGAGMAISFTLDDSDIQKQVNSMMAGISSDESKIPKLGLRLDDGALVKTSADIEKFVRETMAKTQNITQASPFTKMLADTESKLAAVNNATDANPFGRLFNTKAYQQSVALNESIQNISESLDIQNIKEGSDLFKSMGEELQKVAREQGLSNIISSDDLSTLEGYSSALAKVVAKSKEAPVSLQAVMSTVSQIMSGVEGVLGQITSAYGEMAAAAGAAAKAALEHGMSQSQFYMELADTVHYSNNAQAKSFEDKAIAAAEAGAREYQAQKEAQAKANALAKVAFENQKKMQIAQAIMSTAQAVMNTYSNSGLGIYAAPLAAAMGVLGATQVAAISSQQYTPRAKGGPITGGGNYIVGENGPEIMIPNKGGTMIPNNKLSDALGGGGDTNVTFQIIANDTKGFDQLLSSRRGLITNMIREATNSQMRNSPV